LADAEDKHRSWWIDETLKGLDDAIAGGAVIEGYLHWSLLDNFEWADGYWPEFGLIHVNRKTMKRKVRPSARHYADIIKKARAEHKD
jgi:beta-glucosidase